MHNHCLRVRVCLDLQPVLMDLRTHKQARKQARKHAQYVWLTHTQTRILLAQALETTWQLC